MICGKTLLQDEAKEVWNIDRREVVDAVYHLENGVLVLKPEHYDTQGWRQGEVEKYTPSLEACYDQGGWFYGLFDDGRLIGVVVLDARFIGKIRDQLQLKFLHLSRAYRNLSLDKQLFALAKHEARRREARQWYISATPLVHTVGFYLGLECKVSIEPDPDLFALEPEDIHLECALR